MRKWLNVFKESATPPQAMTSFLREFAGDQSRQLLAVVRSLQVKFGVPLYRVGGEQRIYNVDGTGQRGAIYVVGNTVQAIGLAWHDHTRGVSSIYHWSTFNALKEPDYEVVLPEFGAFDKMVDVVTTMLRSQQVGTEAINEGRSSMLSEAKRTTEPEFLRMAQQAYGSKAAKLTWPEIMQVGNQNSVQVPGSIRHNQSLKIDAHHWNLSGAEAADVGPGLEKALGTPVEPAPDPQADPQFQAMLHLAKAKVVGRLVRSGKIYVMGRKPNGAFFRVPGVDEYSAQLERMLSRELDINGKQSTMEEQYNQLKERVTLIASGKSNFIKSLLLTGAPSSGKSYNVMTTIRELGLNEGQDYIIKKGRITASQMYRVLIEQVNGMVIFDDCDSVVDDKNGVNMLKGALDTDAVREISYDVRGTINVAVLPTEKRDEYAMRLSRVLRQVPAHDDAEFFAPFARIKKSKRKDSTPEPEENDGDDFGFDEDDDSDDESQQIFDYVSLHLPNKFDFKGRVIFISNMQQDDWDTAIISRAFVMNLNFSDLEMLDFIDRIKKSINAPGVSEEDKQEVMNYLRELWTLGKLRTSVNFRLVQQCFDLRLTPSWKSLMSLL